MNRITFLDFVGVLNSSKSVERGAIKGGMLQVDPWHVVHLNEIVARSGAKVVVSSTWRLGRTVEELQKILDDAGFKGEVISMTTNVWNRRGNQIQSWMDRFGKPDEFVILDDDSDMEHLMERLVRTNGQKGLLAKHIAPALVQLGVDPNERPDG